MVSEKFPILREGRVSSVTHHKTGRGQPVVSHKTPTTKMI